MSNLHTLKLQVLTLLETIERLESQQSEYSNSFPLSELKTRVNSYCKDNKVTVDIFCELAVISKATLYQAFNHPSSVKRSTIDSILSVLGEYELFVGRKNES